MLYGETVAVYFHNYVVHINTLCGQNGKLLYVKSAGIYGYQRTLKMLNETGFFILVDFLPSVLYQRLEFLGT